MVGDMRFRYTGKADLYEYRAASNLITNTQNAFIRENSTGLMAISHALLEYVDTKQTVAEWQQNGELCWQPLSPAW